MKGRPKNARNLACTTQDVAFCEHFLMNTPPNPRDQRWFCDHMLCMTRPSPGGGTCFRRSQCTRAATGADTSNTTDPPPQQRQQEYSAVQPGLRESLGCEKAAVAQVLLSWARLFQRAVILISRRPACRGAGWAGLLCRQEPKSSGMLLLA